MTLNEAIEILTEDLREDKYFLPSDFKDALELLIEAGKRINTNRLVNNHPNQLLLPGETKD